AMGGATVFGASFRDNDEHDKSTPTVEIVIRGDYSRWSPDIEKATIRALAAIMEISVQEVTILKVSGGSIVLLIKVPDRAAQLLYSLYQDKNPAIAEFDIEKITIDPSKPVQLRLVGHGTAYGRAEKVTLNPSSPVQQDSDKEGSRPSTTMMLPELPTS